MSGAASISVTVKNAAGAGVGERSISTANLDDRVRYRLLKEAVVMHEANRRTGTHKTKSRGEIAGSGKKPWRQKGTGRARAGSRKSPLWRGGGVIFGPRPRDYSYSINKKQRRLALRSAMFSKFSDQEVLVLEGLELSEPKTKALAAALRACGVTGSCLIGTLGQEPSLVLSARNLPRVQVAPIKDWNAFDVLRAATLVLLPEAFEALAAGETAEPESETAKPESETAESESTGAGPESDEV